MVLRYANSFYRQISSYSGKLALNGHTTIAGHSSLTGELSEHIILSDYFLIGKKKIVSAPVGLIECYADELKRRLPWLKIGLNTEVYINVYDHILYRFGYRRGGGIPMIHQETDEALYIEGNRLKRWKLERLRRAFASALLATAERFLRKSSRR